MHLLANQKRLVEQVVNVFETGSVGGDYAQITILKDGPNRIRQITYGRSQTTEYGNLDDLVERYVAAGGAFSQALAPFVPKIGHTPLTDDQTFRKLLKDAGRKDAVMREVQDVFFEERYFQPAMRWARENGFRLPLSALVIYDSFIHSGGVLRFLRNRFPEAVPADGGDERAWTTAYVRVRDLWLRNHSNLILRNTVYRTETFMREIQRGNWNLDVPGVNANGVNVA